MKLVGILVCFSVYVGVVMCEVCTTNGDCTSTTCSGSGQEVICQHPDGAGIVTGGGLCTCQDTGSGGCTTAESCHGSGSSLSCPDNQRHCYDSVCICDRFPIGRSIAE